MRIRLGDEVETLRAHDAVLIAPETPRAVRNASFAMISVRVDDISAESVPHENFWPSNERSRSSRTSFGTRFGSGFGPPDGAMPPDGAAGQPVRLAEARLRPPLLYSVARNDAGSYLDITLGTNTVFSGSTSCCKAAMGYDMASGLGSPLADEIVKHLHH